MTTTAIVFDLTPFGFTPTESRVYEALLELGPSTGYAVAHHAGYARANTYAALENLLRRGAALRSLGRPARYRATDPQSVVLQLAGEQGERLERLSRAAAALRRTAEPVTRPLEGARAVTNVIQQVVARARHQVRGVIAAELWAPTLPVWRLAAGRGMAHIRIAGEVPGGEAAPYSTAPQDHPTLLLVDDIHTILAARGGETLDGLWSAHPLLAALARLALGAAG
jgi:DNA-binding MarR family transcriptional regulator